MGTARARAAETDAATGRASDTFEEPATAGASALTSPGGVVGAPPLGESRGGRALDVLLGVAMGVAVGAVLSVRLAPRLLLKSSPM